MRKQLNAKIKTSLLLFVILTLKINIIQAQIIFKEEFNLGMPSGMVIVNADGLTPNNTVSSLFTNAWVASVAYGNTDLSAISTSWYTPAGSSDDWIITRDITIPNQSQPVYLTWDAQSLDYDRQDGYEIYISKSTQTVNGCLANPPIFVLAKEFTVPGGYKRKIDLSAYKGNTIFLGFRNNSTDQFILSIDNIKVFSASPTDGGVVAIQEPVSGCGYGANETIIVKIVNDGSAAISNFPVFYKLNNNAAVQETVSATIAVGDTLLYAFNTKANLSAIGNYSLVAYTAINGDNLYKQNDTSKTTFDNFTSFDLQNSLNMGFETMDDLTGWKIEDGNRDGIVWGVSDLFPRSGISALRKSGSGDNGDNDWFMSPCLDLIANENYVIEYYYKVFDPNTPCNLELSYGLDQKGSSMITSIIQNKIYLDDLYHFVSVSLKVPASNTYYLGFHAYSFIGSSSLRIDDIVIKKGLSTDLDLSKKLEEILLFPNPSTGFIELQGTLGLLKINKVEILNVLGKQQLLFENLDWNSNKLDLSGLSDGIYFVSMETAETSILKKIQLQR